MSSISRRIRIAAVGAALLMPLGFAACGAQSSAGAAPQPAAGSSAAMSPSPSMTPSMSPSSDSAQPFGAACASVPKTGKGSFDGMSSDPVATAASNNPALSTLVTAVKKARLVDTLNGAKDVTVFAPANSAFEAMDQPTLKKALGDPNGLLTDVLTAHV